MSILDLEGYRGAYDREMEALRVKVTAGDRQAIFTAMELFFRAVHMGIASECPGWLAHGALIPLNEFAEGQHAHMEQAFGINLKPMKAPTRANRLKDRRVFEAVEEAEALRKSGPRFIHRKNDNIEGTFKKVGRKLNMGKGKVSKRYYEYMKRWTDGTYDRAHELKDELERKLKKGA
jgi:hypothetical protein